MPLTSTQLQLHLTNSLPMTTTALPLSASAPDDVSLLANHALPPPTTLSLIPSISTSLPLHHPHSNTHSHSHQHQHQHQHQHTTSISTSPLSPASTSNNHPSSTTTTTTTTATTATTNSSLPSPSKWRVSPNQREILQAAFDINPYPELTRKNVLAQQLGVSTTQVSKWFQHRRETLTRLGQFKAQYNRTRRTPEQLEVLQQAFHVDRYPSAERLQQLESQLPGVTAKQIKLWFKHRRKQVFKRNRPKSKSLSPHAALHSSNNNTHDQTQSPSTSSFMSKQLENHSSSPLQHQQHDQQQQQHHQQQQQQQLNTSFAQSFPPSSAVHTQQQQHYITGSGGLNTSVQMTGHTLSKSNLLSSMQPGSPQPPPPSSTYAAALDNAASSYYPAYRAYPNIVPQQQQKATFSEMEVMALRAANIVTDGKATEDGISRLSRFLNRTHSDIAQWFASENDIAANINTDLTGSSTHAQQPSHPNSNQAAQQQQFIGSPCLTQTETPIMYPPPPQQQQQQQQQQHQQHQQHQ